MSLGWRVTGGGGSSSSGSGSRSGSSSEKGASRVAGGRGLNARGEWIEPVRLLMLNAFPSLSYQAVLP